MPRSEQASGLEPATFGLGNRCSEGASPEKAKAYEISRPPLTPQLTPNSQEENDLNTQSLQTELAQIVAVWSGLPDHIKQAIKTLVSTSKYTDNAG